MIDVQMHLGDCLEVMRGMPPQSIDAIITDLPYGTTACAWDEVIPFAPMWEQVKRVLKPRGVFVTTASQPFTSRLVMSNLEWFKYCWVWDKAQSGNHGLADYQPMKITEDVCVFSKGTHNYAPQMRTGRFRKRGGAAKENEILNGMKPGHVSFSSQYYPVNILDFPNCANKGERVHPTQKPVALYAYLIRTYTNPGDTVLDFVMGSGTTGCAAAKEGRHFVGVELDASYFAIAQKRIEQAQMQLPLLEVT